MNAAAQLKALTRKGQAVRLPSGVEVVLRAPNLVALVQAGRLPRTLYASALAGFPELKALELAAETPQTLERLSILTIEAQEYASIVARAAFVSPAMVDAGQPAGEDEIELSDLSSEDLMFVLELVHMPISKWERFLQARDGAGVRAVPDSQDAGDAP
jgi:hypothetical protein